MSAHAGNKAIVAALGANLSIAALKVVAFALSGSASMLAEAIHSAADSANQMLLMFGGKRARRKATTEHPFGYGRERYIYAFVVSIVIFSLGGLFALNEAIEKFQHPHALDITWAWVPLTVLVGSIILEGYSFITAVKESNHTRGKNTWAQFIRTAKAPELPVVLLEDSAALTGLVFALFGVGMTILTGNGLWDAAGTALIGLLLVAVSVVLVVETKSMLIGEAADPTDIEAIASALVGPGVEGVIHLKTMHLAPEELLVAAKIAVSKDATGEDITEAIDAAEKRVRAVVRIANLIYLEPDLYSAAGSRAQREAVNIGHP
ncbi:cation diffusion facilitator family transporter [Paenarthrobacter sp. YJN-5]|uniref:cation diffusion facilitator family transporter n=1 Tax=Paenarthrobacter sp. YJN-5 TaxID=2735316 RepID=UPI001877552F|nr:cation diffusion facilitator family transporter [Paenarthrobacter sp. YJN-5]QOT19631.1 cation diffusion facilitator family transporter [Paenarthrobacter sp. YJN-5]